MTLKTRRRFPLMYSSLASLSPCVIRSHKASFSSGFRRGSFAVFTPQISTLFSAILMKTSCPLYLCAPAGNCFPAAGAFDTYKISSRKFSMRRRRKIKKILDLDKEGDSLQPFQIKNQFCSIKRSFCKQLVPFRTKSCDTMSDKRENVKCMLSGL